jgi:hypothetical protein
VAVLMVGLFAGSATADRYMPSDEGVGLLAYVSQLLRQADGQCPAHTGTEDCDSIAPGRITRDGRTPPGD